MSRTIWKFPLTADRHQAVLMPEGATILCVMHQGGQIPTVWAEVDAAAAVEQRNIVVVGTGHPTPAGRSTHLGSAVCGMLVWHVYEEHDT